MSNSIEKLAKEAERLAENLQSNPFLEFDRIAKEIQEQKDNAIAMEFTECIGGLLRKNGVVPKITEYQKFSPTFDKIGEEYGVTIEKLDFSEHDRQFKERIGFLTRKNEKLFDENASLKQRIAELERKETETVSDIDTSNPLACAESLIEHMTHCEKFMIMPERDVQTFSVEELKEIADYLMVYYRHHRDRDAEEPISF